MRTRKNKAKNRLSGAAAVLAVAAAALGACGGPAAPAASTPSTGPAAATSQAAAPEIPHDLAGRDDCTSCHELGAKAPTGMPADHKDRNNASCTGCHRLMAK
jgi:hypothetical protein